MKYHMSYEYNMNLGGEKLMHIANEIQNRESSRIHWHRK